MLGSSRKMGEYAGSSNKDICKTGEDTQQSGDDVSLQNENPSEQKDIGNVMESIDLNLAQKTQEVDHKESKVSDKRKSTPF